MEGAGRAADRRAHARWRGGARAAQSGQGRAQGIREAAVDPRPDA